ncbi:MAG TPA: hypothetical protein VEC76_05365 [Streptosporangiaceae bacterium]|nr:hypothetical protein [Streptosporangiaceae bacterium]
MPERPVARGQPTVPGSLTVLQKPPAPPNPADWGRPAGPPPLTVPGWLAVPGWLTVLWEPLGPPRSADWGRSAGPAQPTVPRPLSVRTGPMVRKVLMVRKRPTV